MSEPWSETDEAKNMEIAELQYQRDHLKKVMLQAFHYFRVNEENDHWAAVVVDNMREALGEKRQHNINDLSDDPEERNELEELRHFSD